MLAWQTSKLVLGLVNYTSKDYLVLSWQTSKNCTIAQSLVRSNSSVLYLTLGTLTRVDLLGVCVVSGDDGPDDAAVGGGLGGALGEAAAWCVLSPRWAPSSSLCPDTWPGRSPPIGAKRGGTREQCSQKLFELAEISGFSKLL